MRRLVLALLLAGTAGAQVHPEMAHVEVRAAPVVATMGQGGSGDVTILYRHGPAVTMAPTAIDLTAAPEDPRLNVSVSPGRVWANVATSGGETEVHAHLIVTAQRWPGGDTTAAVSITAAAQPNGNLPAAGNTTRTYVNLQGYGGTTDRDFVQRELGPREGPAQAPAPRATPESGFAAALAMAVLAAAMLAARRR